MNHGVDGRKFGRNTPHRAAMFRNMANSLITDEQIVTTVQKAKEVKRLVDRLITLGKKGNDASKRLAFGRTRSGPVVTKLFAELSKRYGTRAGGYTRVIKLSDRRWGDAAEMAVLELVDKGPLLRKRKLPKAEAAPQALDGTESAATETTASAPMDPFSRFRKMLGVKKAKN